MRFILGAVAGSYRGKFKMATRNTCMAYRHTNNLLGVLELS